MSSIKYDKNKTEEEIDDLSDENPARCPRLLIHVIHTARLYWKIISLRARGYFEWDWRKIAFLAKM